MTRDQPAGRQGRDGYESAAERDELQDQGVYHGVSAAAVEVPLHRDAGPSRSEDVRPRRHLRLSRAEARPAREDAALVADQADRTAADTGIAGRRRSPTTSARRFSP